MRFVSMQKVLDDALLQIPVLLHGKKDPTVLEGLTREAVQAYQDRAGFTGEFTLELDEFNKCLLPADYLETLIVSDKNSVFVSTSVSDGEIAVSCDFSLIEKPYRLKYLKDLAQADFNEEVLPVSSVGVIKKYLQVIIEIPNNTRLRSMMTGLDHPGAADVEDSQSLTAKADALLEQMDESADLLFPAMVM